MPKRAREEECDGGEAGLSREDHLTKFKDDVEVAESMIPLLGDLYRNQNIVTTLFGVSLVNQSVIDIIKNHRRVEKYIDGNISVHACMVVLRAVASIRPHTVRLDLGKATKLCQAAGKTAENDVRNFVREKLEAAGLLRTRPALTSEGEGQDIVLYGFGRIGRLLARIFIEKTGGGDKLRLRAIVVRGGNLAKRAALLRRDSTHGPFRGTIQLDEDENAIIANGNKILLLSGDGPDKMDYSKHGIKDAILIDNTGAARDKEALSKHLESPGIKQVLLTAPAPDIPNIVVGCNDNTLKKEETVIAAASCTTNAVSPILKLMNAKFGVEHGHVETVHSFTNDQNLLDNFHKKARRGRAAPMNLVITETGAAQAVAKTCPELAGRITGNSIRVPTSDVSLAILMLTVTKETTVEEVNKVLYESSLSGPQMQQIDFSQSEETVSSDFVGSKAAGVVDGPSTAVHGGKRINLYIWYDNEFGYSCQVVRLTQILGGIDHPRFPSA